MSDSNFTPDNPLDFDTIANIFVELGSINPPSEFHGMLVGQLSGKVRLDHDSWFRTAAEFMDVPATLSGNAKVVLIDLYEKTLEQLVGTEFELVLLIPDDEESISMRAEALGQWCRGFLAGLGTSGQLKPDSINDELRSVLHDFAEIAQVEHDLDDEEANEQDFFQVFEYVRMATLMVFSELGALEQCANEQAKAEQTPPKHLH